MEIISHFLRFSAAFCRKWADNKLEHFSLTALKAKAIDLPTWSYYQMRHIDKNFLLLFVLMHLFYYSIWQLLNFWGISGWKECHAYFFYFEYIWITYITQTFKTKRNVRNKLMWGKDRIWYASLPEFAIKIVLKNHLKYRNNDGHQI